MKKNKTSIANNCDVLVSVETFSAAMEECEKS